MAPKKNDMEPVRKKLYAAFEAGDIRIRYLIDEEERVGLSIVPKNLADQTVEDEFRRIDPLVQVKIAGDAYSTGYSNGVSLRNSASVRHGLKLNRQEYFREGGETVVRTVLRDPRGIEAIHTLRVGKENVLCCEVRIVNGSEEEITLELLESFNMSEITPFETGMGEGSLRIYRMRSDWQCEGMEEITSPEALGLLPAKKRFAVLSERFGAVGNKPLHRYVPFAAVRDERRGVIWAAMLSIGSSWQMELYRRDNGLVLAGGIADADTGNWIKNLKPGESFAAPAGYLSVCVGDLDDVCDRFVQYFDNRTVGLPESEEELPLQFNEYRATIGQPDEEKILAQARALAGRGFRYFMIDAGWYFGHTGKWYEYLGDWQPNAERFPHGLKYVSREMAKLGFDLGIWFEPEACGKGSCAFQNCQEHLVHRYGKVLTCGWRRFWDLRDPWVQQYLKEKVIGLLREGEIRYVKLDSNESLGAGIDGAESFGEALREYALEVENFYDAIRRELPETVIENCSAGGARAIFSLTKRSSVTSFSDSFDTPNNPVVAANLQRLIPARQNLVWCVVDPSYDEKRMRYSLCSATFGRFCLTGNILKLSEEQNRRIDEAVAFYKACVPVIRKGHSRRFGMTGGSCMDPEGWQAVRRTGEDGNVLITVHSFAGELPEELEIPLEEGNWRLKARFSGTEQEFQIRDGKLLIRNMTNCDAAALLLVRV